MFVKAGTVAQVARRRAGMAAGSATIRTATGAHAALGVRGSRAAGVMGLRGYKNYVYSETLCQLERDCNRTCEVPVPRLQKVTILGAGSEVGIVASLMLKQQPVVRQLAMYDESPCVLGAATDIAHLDTSVGVDAYQGQPYLPCALSGADVVLLCGGEGCVGAGAPERDSFAANARWVRGYVMAVAQFAPEALLAIQTPPVDANFSLAMHLLKQMNKFDRRRLVGINAPSAMRASQLAGKWGTSTPVVGGAGRRTRVPVFGTIRNLPQSVDTMTKLVRQADELVCQMKGGCGEAHLSVGFACARFVVELMQGLFEGRRSGDSGVVLTKGEGGLKVQSGPLALGPAGVMGCLQPTLNEHEKRLLTESECDMKDMLRLGRCYATNEYYFMHPCKCISSQQKKS